MYFFHRILFLLSFPAYRYASFSSPPSAFGGVIYGMILLAELPLTIMLKNLAQTAEARSLVLVSSKSIGTAFMRPAAYPKQTEQRYL